MSELMRDTAFLGRPVLAKGKIREMYDLGDSLLMIVTDRISAFDVVFDELIPDKGVILNSISSFWFEQTAGIIRNHVISTDPAEYPDGLDRFADRLAGRSMWVRKAEMQQAECIVRGYLEGSALKEYRQHCTVGGMKMPAGLRQADKLPEPLFTPSTKSSEGHDINITFAQLCDIVGDRMATNLRDKSLDLYDYASKYAEKRGILIADSKFEFGMLDGELAIADELFTPDSSRFWDLADYKPGRAQKSFDKQYLREYLETLDWSKTYPAPPLPAEIVEKTAEKYREAYERLTGRTIG